MQHSCTFLLFDLHGITISDIEMVFWDEEMGEQIWRMHEAASGDLQFMAGIPPFSFCKLKKLSFFVTKKTMIC